MMIEGIIAAAASLVLTAAYAFAFRRRTRPLLVLTFFAIILVASFSGGLLMRPAGPAPGGVYWLPFLLLASLLALLLAASIPRRPPKNRLEVARRLDNEYAVRLSIRILSVLLVVSLVLAGVVHYLTEVPDLDRPAVSRKEATLSGR